MKTTFRCDAVTVQVIVTEYDEHGRPCGEQLSQPAKFFRSKTLNFWSEIDRAVAALEKQRKQEQVPTELPLALKRGQQKQSSSK